MSGRKALQDAVASSDVACPYHDSMTMTLFCYTCEELICRDCTLVTHLNHTFEFLPKCAPKTRKHLGDLTISLLKIQADVKVALKRLERIEAQIGVQEATTAADIRGAFEKMREELEKRELELLNKLGNMVEEKRGAISEQTVVLRDADGEIQATLDTVQETLEEASDGDLMATRAQLESRVKREEKAHRNLPLTPSVAADIASNFPTPAAKDLSRFGDVFYATIDDPPITEVKRKSTLTLRLHNARDLKLLHVDASFKSLANPEVATPVQVEQKSMGVYAIHYVPAERGRHDLNVKINSVNIPGSPFRVFVKVHPTQLGNPILSSETMGKPYGVAIVPNGEIIVAQNGGKELTFCDKRCRKLRSIISDRFYYPRCVAIGTDGSVFSTDKIEYTLMKFQKMKLVKAINKGSNSVRGLKLINGYLYACDMATSQIHIFTENLEHLSSFDTREVPNPHDLAAGEDGLYIIGSGENDPKIGVYSYEGKFIREIKIFGRRVKLSTMRGICFDCYGHMFITQAGPGVKGIYVFKTSGEYVASFGLSNPDVDFPVSVAIDEDGFVYVSDHSNTIQRIHIF